MLDIDERAGPGIGQPSTQDAYHGHKSGGNRHARTLEIIELPCQRMAVVHTVGDPDRVMHLVLPALYSSVHALNRDLRNLGRDFRVGHLRVRWPDAHIAPIFQWHGIWGLPIPEDITFLPQMCRHIAVETETWEYGTVAQVVHKGPRSQRALSIELLNLYIAENGYAIAGPLEEEWLIGPEPNLEKILVRYPVRSQKLLTAPGPVREPGPVLTRGGK